MRKRQYGKSRPSAGQGKWETARTKPLDGKELGVFGARKPIVAGAQWRRGGQVGGRNRRSMERQGGGQVGQGLVDPWKDLGRSVH